MNEKVSSELIHKFLNGQATEEEEHLIMLWYESRENEHDPVDLLNQYQKDQLMKRMRFRIQEKIGLGHRVSERHIVLRPILKYAVAAIAAMVVIALSINRYKVPDKLNVIGNTVTASTADTVIRNTSVKMLRHVFPDSSLAWLDPRSEIRYHRNFAGKQRKISLKGGAFFEVTHNPERPFVITSGKVVTQVLGTSFTVRAPENGSRAEVSVLTGKVMVYMPEKDNRALSRKVFLLPNEKAVYEASKNTLVKNESANAEIMIWKKSNLSFDNTPMNEVVKALNDTFNSSIRIDNESIKHYMLSADFNKVNLVVILDMLQTSLDISYQKTDKEIILTKSD